ncbi:hypothetical protein D3C84_1061160 [compost metagenome]
MAEFLSQFLANSRVFFHQGQCSDHDVIEVDAIGCPAQCVVVIPDVDGQPVGDFINIAKADFFPAIHLRG